MLFGDATCDDTDDSFVVVWAVGDEDVLVGVDLFFGIFECCVLEGFAVCVEVFEFLEFFGLARSGMQKSSQTVVWRSDSSSGIDSGSDNEADMKGIDVAFYAEELYDSFE